MNKHLLKLLIITIGSSVMMSSVVANPVYRDSHAYSYSVEPHYQPQHRSYVYPDYQQAYGYSSYGHNDYDYNEHSVDYIDYIDYGSYEHGPTIVIETFSGGH